MKLVTIIGARPQFIKAAPFSMVFREKNQEILIHTGQHYDANMSDVFFEELGLPVPDYNLGVGSGKHGQQTGRMLEKIEDILVCEEPDGVLVYGDTNSTLAGALAASKLHIPVFHVEAGLRSYNKLMPEEQNRILTDHISDLLLCPTRTAVENLKKEGIVSGAINTGDIMYDAVLRNFIISENKYSNGAWLNEIIRLTSEENTGIDLIEKGYYLATIHRAENTDNPQKLKTIFEAFNTLDRPVILPIHPRTYKLISELNICSSNIILLQPVGYLLMLYLTANAFMVLTDSGGLQKEAYFLQTPCTTLRDQTEWVETLVNGWNILTSINIDEIVKCAARKFEFLDLPQPSLFGDGNAAKQIISAIQNHSESRCLL